MSVRQTDPHVQLRSGRAEKLTNRLLGLHRVSTALTGQRDEAALTRIVLRETARLLEAESTSLYLWDEAAGLLRPVESFPEAAEPVGEVLRTGSGAVGQCWAREATLLINDYADWRHAVPRCRQAGLRSAAAALLQPGDRQMGVLVARRFQVGPGFDPEDGLLLELMAAQAAAALERARLDAEQRAETEVSAALLRLAREVGERLDEPSLLQRITELAVEVFGADASTIALSSQRDGRLVRAAFAGDINPAERAYLERPDVPVLGPAVRRLLCDSSRPLLVEDVLSSGYYEPGFLDRVRCSSTILIPLLDEGVLLGVVSVDWTSTRRAFVERDRLLAEGLSRLLVNALLRVRGDRQVQLLSDAVAALMDGIGVTDLQGCLQTANPAFGRLIGCLPDALIGRYLQELVVGDQSGGGVDDWFRETLERGAWTGDVLVAQKRGGQLPARLTLSLVRGGTGRPVGYSAILHDLTVERQVQERLVQTEKLRALGQMAAGAAHDFNNLLSLVLGRAEVARARLQSGEATSSEVAEVLGLIEQAAEDGAATIRRIQEFTRTQPERPPERVAVAPLVEKVLDLTRPRWQDQAQRQGITIEAISEVEAGLECAGQPSELREALINLVLNAVDAMPSGGILRISGERRAGRAVIKVSDTGIGMTQAIRQRAFEPFFTTKGERGNGLGLSMVYAIVQRHDGEIELQTAAGQGTTFAIELPLPGGARACRPDPGRGPSSGFSARVLVVDDEPSLARVLAQMLESAGHTAILCSSAREAIQRFREGSYDAIFTDLGMPEMDGLQLASRIRSIDPDVGIVLVTGWGAQLDLAEVRQWGADLVIPKPYRLRAISDALAEIVDGAKGRG